MKSAASVSVNAAGFWKAGSNGMKKNNKSLFIHLADYLIPQQLWRTLAVLISLSGIWNFGISLLAIPNRFDKKEIS